jgi:ADP-ribosylglycohydrolase
MLVEIAIGDAYGRAFEFAEREFIEANNDLLSYKHRPGELEEGMKESLGVYTDDTQMSIAIAEVLIKRTLFDPDIGNHQEYFQAFRKAYQRDRRGGYSRRLRSALESTRFLQFIDSVEANAKNSNGCVMRTLPLGFLMNPDRIISEAITHASLTHCSLDAIDATVITALTAHNYYYDLGDYERWMIDFVGKDRYERMRSAYQDGPLPCDAMATASLAIKIAESGMSMRNMLRYAIDVGGDTDSTAAVALGLASVKRDVKNDLPGFLYSNLEQGKYGIGYLRKLDAQLESTVY